MKANEKIDKLIEFSAEVHRGIRMMSKNDVRQNIQLYIENGLGVDYFTSVNLSEVVGKTLWKNRGSNADPKHIMKAVKDDLVLYATQARNKA